MVPRIKNRMLDLPLCYTSTRTSDTHPAQHKQLSNHSKSTCPLFPIQTPEMNRQGLVFIMKLR